MPALVETLAGHKDNFIIVSRATVEDDHVGPQKEDSLNVGRHISTSFFQRLNNDNVRTSFDWILSYFRAGRKLGRVDPSVVPNYSSPNFIYDCTREEMIIYSRGRPFPMQLC